MIRVRRAQDRGHAQHGWLESYHTFSFAGYRDLEHMGFRSLRVINEDRVQPGKGFDTHSHSDMEIISYVLTGALEHKDSMGNGSVIRPGDVQLMRAGTGVTHSEYNHSDEDLVHFFQIWILPDEEGLKPAYDQRHFPLEEQRNALRLVASRDGREASVLVHQDAEAYAAVLDKGRSVAHPLAPGRHAWLQVARGAARLNGSSLEEGDGAAVSGETMLDIAANGQAEILLFDLA
jgi:quercetin 2,3-dioxygenase